MQRVRFGGKSGHTFDKLKFAHAPSVRNPAVKFRYAKAEKV